ncbi:MAG: hypothetical protein WC389_14200 [Lutibacter sp.]|jgi:hypothetical protein
MTQKEFDKLKKGQKCKIVNSTSGHSFPMGEVVKFDRIEELSELLNTVFTSLDGKDYWWVLAEDVEKV